MATHTCSKCGHKEKILKQFYSVGDVAEIFDVSRLTVHRRIKSGDLKSIKFGNLRRIPVKAIKEFLDT